MIGPVQLIVIGYDKPDVAGTLRAKVQELTADPAVRILDVLCARKNRDGTIEVGQLEDPIGEHPHEPGALIGRLLTSARAAKTMGQTASTGQGRLFRGDVLPDPREAIPAGSGVLAILLEHRWAIPLRDTAVETGAYAVANGWMGREALKDVHLVPADS